MENCASWEERPDSENAKATDSPSWGKWKSHTGDTEKPPDAGVGRWGWKGVGVGMEGVRESEADGESESCSHGEESSDTQRDKNENHSLD